MLIDLDFIPFTKEQQSRWKSFQIGHPDIGPLEHPVRLAKGLYGHLTANSDKTVQWLVDDEAISSDGYREQGGIRRMITDADLHQRNMNRLYSQKYNRGPYRGPGTYTSYGVCDGPAELLALFPHLADDEVKRVISFSAIYREDQSSSLGFRYHKSGTYYGKQKPQHEYLYDDKHIEMVCCFRIYRVDEAKTE